jgi:hypothetical protein
MKKQLLLLTFIALIGSYTSYAQEIIKGGNMEDENDWTVIDVGNAFDPSAITFNYDIDVPSAGKGGCLSISGAGITRNFIYQKVTLTKGHTYYLSCALKNASAADLTNYWLEVNLVNKEPVLVGDGTSADFGASKSDFQLGMHYWKSVNGVDYSRIETGYDGLIEKTLNFAYLGAGAAGDSIITSPRDPAFNGMHGDSIFFILPDTVSTIDWYVLIKAGEFMTAGLTEPVYNWLLDELTLWDMAEPLPATSSIYNPSASQKNFEIFPNPITGGFLTIKSSSPNETSYQLYNSLGTLIKSDKTDGIIDVSKLSKGLYVLSLDNGSISEHYKIIIK